MRNTCRTRLLAVGSPGLAFFLCKRISLGQGDARSNVGAAADGRLRREAMVMELELAIAMRRDG